MKTEEEIRNQLRQTYEYRLNLRITRKQKNSCKNCQKGVVQNLDLGQLGEYITYSCTNGYENKCNNCSLYKCKYTRQMIQEQMIQDIKDPSICGCKQPKIAALLWVLHTNKTLEKEQKKQIEKKEQKKGNGFLNFFFRSK